MGEERSVCLINSRRNTGQEPYLIGVLRRWQDHFRIRWDGEKTVIQREKTGKPHPIPQLGSGWCPWGSSFLKAQRIRAPEGGSSRLWRAGSYEGGRLEREQGANGQATKLRAGGEVRRVQ